MRLFLLALLCLPSISRAETLMSLDFSSSPVGVLSETFPLQACGAPWVTGLRERRAEIVGLPEAREGRSLRARFVGGGIGPESAVQFPCRVPPRESAYAEYWVRFPADFEFVRGGKLPGLCGGRCNAGGKKPKDGEGFSSRLMWRSAGKLILYLYHMDQPGKYGEVFDLGLDAQPGVWYKIGQRVTLNTPKRRDGAVEVWVNDRPALKRQGLRLRAKNDVKIDKFLVETFFGGDDLSWAPPADTYVDFDGLRVLDDFPGK
jgi:hypothetical protein